MGALFGIGCTADIVFAFRGQKPDPNMAYVGLLWGGLFFYLWWKRRGRKGWQGSSIGVVLSILVFMLATFIAAYTARAAT